MAPRGFSHIGLSTLDLDRPRDFYERVLGFTAVRCELLAFMEASGVPGIPAEYDAGIHRGLGVPGVFKSIYFKDPNGLQLELCCYTRNLNADDARMQPRAGISVRPLGLDDPVAPSSAKR